MNTIEEYGDGYVFGKLIEGTLTEYEDDESEFSLRSNAFRGITTLTNIKMPNCTQVGEKCCWSCTELSSFIFDSVKNIESEAFYKTKLSNVYAPLVTSIGTNAFHDCKNLTECNFPIMYLLGGAAFSRCNSLKQVDLPSVTRFTNSSNGVFEYCTSLEEITLPLVTSLPNRIFWECASLKKIDLPSVTTLDCTYGFYNISRTAIIILRSKSVVSLTKNDTYVDISDHKIYVPDDLVESYKEATNWSSIASKIHPISELPEEE